MMSTNKLCCNIGDTVFLVKPGEASFPFLRQVVEIRMTKTSTTYVTQNARTGEIQCVSDHEFGKTAFTTVEAAMTVLKNNGNPDVVKRWIQIWYSWGDQESPIEVPQWVNPWEYMKKLAADEAERDFSEHEDEGEIGLQFFKNEGKIVLHYPSDNEYCYYLITETEEFDSEEYEKGSAEK